MSMNPNANGGAQPSTPMSVGASLELLRETATSFEYILHHTQLTEQERMQVAQALQFTRYAIQRMENRQ